MMLQYLLYDAMLRCNIAYCNTLIINRNVSQTIPQFRKWYDSILR